MQIVLELLLSIDVSQKLAILISVFQKGGHLCTAFFSLRVLRREKKGNVTHSKANTSGRKGLKIYWF